MKAKNEKRNYIKLFNLNYTVKAALLSIKILLFFIILLLLILIFNHLNHKLSEHSGMPVSEKSDINERIIVIDAGHGGEDGGAVGINGCIEKDLNLDTALVLYDLLRVSDIPVVLTRDSDIMLHNNAFSGKKKTGDLKKRLEITEGYEDPILISIHMNSYPSPKYSGMQVYYSPNDPESKEIAEIIQTTVKEMLQPDNSRQIKAATSAIYLLHNTTKPAVLVECGFISNEEEAELLCSESYRNKLALSIYKAIMNHLSLKDQTT